MSTDQSLFIPVLLGTARQGRMSEPVARFILGEVAKRPGITTELIDVRGLALSTLDAGEAIKHPHFSAAMARADALIIVTPEYNHGYPGLLKHALDSNYKEYTRKAVGLCGVSVGGFGGVRVIESLLPVLKALGLVTIVTDLNFGEVKTLFDPSGNLLDQAYVRRCDRFLTELVWMAATLRHGREQIPLP
ncbi:NADPH-dependent FMN reductase [Neosynechococcus sphagnicola sy1]|uniref:NADPH-dependent FMN reductase n=1 Tax=Neosynechococcus sphagnicola sy1 TaxID=1497020 RepID=A0A098TFV9_9CYAN|nr:NAD(P)H-dependent oxidoreductase [Neosynechococcus sphagnicola]KGF71435.1 NADPH-dependent FMN reductase [Neosynechococcus sphagnicola sy1]